MSSQRLCPFFVAALLAGCGAEVAGTAANVATMQAQQAQAAKAQQLELEKRLAAALKATEASASVAASQ